MSMWEFPWLDASVAAALIGALGAVLLRDIGRSFRWGVFCTGLALVCAILAWIGFSVHGGLVAGHPCYGVPVLFVDGLSASLATLTALLYFLTTLATGRTKMGRFSITWSLASEAIQLTAFGCTEPWILIALLVLATVPPYIVLRNRGKPTRVYVVHMALFNGMLILGWALVSTRGGNDALPAWATIPLLAAILVRCGTIPAHCWITDWFEHASFGNALLFVVPLLGVYAAVRLILPVAPEWALQTIGVLSLITAVYAAGMAIIQQDARRFFAFLFLSHASLVLVGMELHTPISLTGALSMWFSVALAIGGLGLTLRALEARFGRLSLSRFHGLYDHSPALAVCFLLTGLASVGFPGTIGFVATEMLVDGAVETNLFLGIAVVIAAALNGIAVVRAYLLLFTGTRHTSTISLNIGLRERIAVLTLAALIIVGGLFPQPGVSSRHHAAEAILKDRADRQKRYVNPNDESFYHVGRP
jgi:NADH-quinone oxidoreductase subunit M